jgi:hypothetical protein
VGHALVATTGGPFGANEHQKQQLCYLAKTIIKNKKCAKINK